MKIVLEFNRMIVDKQGLNAIVGSFVDSSDYLLTPNRKPARRRRRKKGYLKASNLIDDLISEITER